MQLCTIPALGRSGWLSTQDAQRTKPAPIQVNPNASKSNAQQVRTLSSSRVKPRPARFFMLYLTVCRQMVRRERVACKGSSGCAEREQRSGAHEVGGQLGKAEIALAQHESPPRQQHSHGTFPTGRGSNACGAPALATGRRNTAQQKEDQAHLAVHHGAQQASHGAGRHRQRLSGASCGQTGRGGAGWQAQRQQTAAALPHLQAKRRQHATAALSPAAGCRRYSVAICQAAVLLSCAPTNLLSTPCTAARRMPRSAPLAAASLLPAWP